MQPIHFEGLEQVEFDACADLYRAAPKRAARTRVPAAIGRVLHDVAGRTRSDVSPRRRRGHRHARARPARRGAGLHARHRSQARRPARASGESAGPRFVARATGYTRGVVKFSRPCTDRPRRRRRTSTCASSAACVGCSRGRRVRGCAQTSPWIAALVGRPNWRVGAGGRSPRWHGRSRERWARVARLGSTVAAHRPRRARCAARVATPRSRGSRRAHRGDRDG